MWCDIDMFYWSDVFSFCTFRGQRSTDGCFHTCVCSDSQCSVDTYSSDPIVGSEGRVFISLFSGVLLYIISAPMSEWLSCRDLFCSADRLLEVKYVCVDFVFFFFFSPFYFFLVNKEEFHRNLLC